MTGVNKDTVLNEIGLDVRMELMRIIDPRRDRDMQQVLSEVQQILSVLVRAIEKVSKLSLDKSATAMALSQPAAQEATPDAEDHHPPPAGDAASTASVKRRKRSQIPL